MTGENAADHVPSAGDEEQRWLDTVDIAIPGTLMTLEARAHLWSGRPDNARAILASPRNIVVDRLDRIGVTALLACAQGQLR